MITVNQGGFDAIQLETDNFAHLTGSLYDGGGAQAFHVSMTGNLVDHERTSPADGRSWVFDYKAAVEASAFFKRIAEELLRRELTATKRGR